MDGRVNLGTITDATHTAVVAKAGPNVKQTQNYGIGDPVLIVDAHVNVGQILIQMSQVTS